MPTGMLFWLIFVLCVLFGGWVGYSSGYGFYRLGGDFVVYILLGLLGWKTFGPPIQ